MVGRSLRDELLSQAEAGEVPTLESLAIHAGKVAGFTLLNASREDAPPAEPERQGEEIETEGIGL